MTPGATYTCFSLGVCVPVGLIKLAITENQRQQQQQNSFAATATEGGRKAPQLATEKSKAQSSNSHGGYDSCSSSIPLLFLFLQFSHLLWGFRPKIGWHWPGGRPALCYVTDRIYLHSSTHCRLIYLLASSAERRTDGSPAELLAWGFNSSLAKGLKRSTYEKK